MKTIPGRLSRLQRWILIEAYRTAEHPQHGRQIRGLDDRIAQETRRMERLKRFPCSSKWMRPARRIAVLEAEKRRLTDLAAASDERRHFVTKRRIYEGYFGLKADRPSWSSNPMPGGRAYLGAAATRKACCIVTLSRSLARLKAKGLIEGPSGARFTQDIVLTTAGKERAKCITANITPPRHPELHDKPRAEALIGRRRP